MWLCSTCGLAQLVGEPIVAEEPLGAEPEALVAQAADAVERLAATGWLSGRSRVVEFASPHGGSWLGLLADRGLAPVADGGPGDVVIDSFGMMHDPDQAAALAERMARVAPGASSCFSTTRWRRLSGWASGMPSGTGTSPTTRPARWWECWRPTGSAHRRRGDSSSTAARSSWRPAGNPRPAPQSTDRWRRSCRTTAAGEFEIRSQWGACSDRSGGPRPGTA